MSSTNFSKIRNSIQTVTLPITYITETQFLKKISFLPTLSHSKKIQEALKIAKIVHLPLKRKNGNNSFEYHILPTAHIVLENEMHLKSQATYLEELLVTAILHDVYEDSKTLKIVFDKTQSPAELSLSKTFGPRISENVRLLSHNSLAYPPNLPKNLQDEMYVCRLKGADLPVKTVKCADRISNLTSDIELLMSGDKKTLDFVARFLLESKILYKPLFDEVGVVNPRYVALYQYLLIKLESLLNTHI
jgi:(p)ppGpp synthase/HD superfamily hydrolase